MRRIGFVVNPVAGMGGRVGLKGTDDKAEAALERGAELRAPDRAIEALEALKATEPSIELVTVPGLMGEKLARAAGFDPTVIEIESDVPTESDPAVIVGATSAADTRRAVRGFLDADVDLILFAGGDGTAVDVAETLEEADADVPILGIPAGVKIYSAVFGVSPQAAGRVAGSYDRTERAEVNDIDEAEYRNGTVNSRLKAVTRVPVAQERQLGKQRVGGSVESLAAGVARGMEGEPEITYVLGPGGTVGAIKDELGFDGSPLGVDVWRDGEVLVTDGAEDDILAALGDENVIVVSPIGGQGFVLGRGNQQLSPEVVRRCDLAIVASRRKLDGVDVLRVDTGDPTLDAELGGWHRVRVGRFETRLVEVVPASERPKGDG